MGDPSKRAFTYFVLTGGRFIYASALRLAVLKFILSMTVRPVGIPYAFLRRHHNDVEYLAEDEQVKSNVIRASRQQCSS